LGTTNLRQVSASAGIFGNRSGGMNLRSKVGDLGEFRTQ
jgi:hypothetical protein